MKPVTTTDIADALCAEFVIQHRAGGNDVDRSYLAACLAKELVRGGAIWAYYNNSGKTLRTTPDKVWAEQNADGFNWDNPRVRRCALVQFP